MCRYECCDRRRRRRSNVAAPPLVRLCGSVKPRGKGVREDPFERFDRMLIAESDEREAILWLRRKPASLFRNGLRAALASDAADGGAADALSHQGRFRP